MARHWLRGTATGAGVGCGINLVIAFGILVILVLTLGGLALCYGAANLMTAAPEPWSQSLWTIWGFWVDGFAGPVGRLSLLLLGIGAAAFVLSVAVGTLVGGAFRRRRGDAE